MPVAAEAVTALVDITVTAKEAIMLAATKTFWIIFSIFLLLGIFHGIALAEEHDATVTTDSGSYTVPVEIEDGAVTQVHWPNGGDMNVYGGDLSGGEASGTNSRGDVVSVSIDDYPAESNEDNGSEDSESDS